MLSQSRLNHDQRLNICVLPMLALLLLKNRAVSSSSAGWFLSLGSHDAPLEGAKERDPPWRLDLLPMSRDKPGLSARGGSAEVGLAGDDLLPLRDDTGLDSSSLSNPNGSSKPSADGRGLLKTPRTESFLGAPARLEPTLALYLVSPHLVLRVPLLVDRTSSNLDVPSPPLRL